MNSEEVIQLSEENFGTTVDKGLTLVDFWAEWCQPCLALAPAIAKLAEDYRGKLQVAKVNIDHHPALPTKFGIRGIPTTMLFRDGEQIDIFVGNNPAKIVEMVDRALAG